MTNLFSDPESAGKLSAWESSVNTLLDSMESSQNANDKALADYRNQGKSIKASIKAEERNISGFDAPRFTVAAEIAKLWNATFPVDNHGKRPDVAENAAKSALATWERRSGADRTDKTAKGGTDATIIAFIMLGEGAERVRGAIARRLAHWQGEYDSAEGENPAETAAIKARAARYLTPANKDKHNGGPSGVFGPAPGILIGDADGKPRGGTNRTAQIGLLARLYRDFGANALHSEVVDAILDNGGKRAKVSTLADVCNDTVELLAKLSAIGGADSGDETLLSMLRMRLKAIAVDGKFAPAVAATPVIPRPTPAPVATPAPSMPDPSTLLATDPNTLTGAVASPAPAQQDAKPETSGRRGRGNMAA